MVGFGFDKMFGKEMRRKTNKTKVLNVQLGKTLCLTKYSLQGLKKALKSENLVKTFLNPRIVETLGFSSLTYMKPTYQMLAFCYA